MKNADSRRRDWKHPHRRYADRIWTYNGVKVALGGTGDMNQEEFLVLLSKDVKAAAMIGGYGGGSTTQCLGVLGDDFDDENPFESEEESLLALPTAFQRFRSRTGNLKEDFIKTFGRPFAQAQKETFPADVQLNTFLRKYWRKHVGADCKGTPPSWRMPDGFTHQPSRIRRNRKVHTGLHYNCPVTDTRTTVTRKVLDPNPGLELSPNVTHGLDALVMRICVLLMKQEGIPVIAIHDCVGVPIPFLRRANQLYVEAVNWAISENIWEQFGFKLFGPIPKLDPDCRLLMRD